MGEDGYSDFQRCTGVQAPAPSGDEVAKAHVMHWRFLTQPSTWDHQTLASQIVTCLQAT